MMWDLLLVGLWCYKPPLSSLCRVISVFVVYCTPGKTGILTQEFETSIICPLFQIKSTDDLKFGMLETPSLIDRIRAELSVEMFVKALLGAVHTEQNRTPSV